MILNTLMNNPKLTFYDLGHGVKAFSTTRHGGCSTGNYGELNVNAYCGDSAEAVAANRKSLCATLGIEPSHLVVPHQVHRVESRLIAPELFSLPLSVQDKLLDGVDAVMTQMNGVCIGVSTADCIPVLLYDEVHRACAAVHAGWRGTLNHVVLKTVREMAISFSSKPQDLRAIIGPGISVDHFEVGQEVYDQFAQLNFDMHSMARQYPAERHSPSEPPLKWHLDLKWAHRADLRFAGLADEHIADCGICTYEQVADYFSARRLGTASGRIYTGIMMTD